MIPLYERKECLFCESDRWLQELYPQSFTNQDLNSRVFSARRETDHIHYHMVRCRNCGLVFSRDVLPPARLAMLYESSAVTFDAYQAHLRRDYWKILEPYMSTIVARSALEIGCSSGFFLEELKSRGFKQVTGYEPSLEAKGRASPSIQPFIISEVFRDSSDSPGRPFDLVCSFHTLDHVSDPISFVQSCFKALRKGGLCCIVVHDVNAWQARWLKERSPIIDIQHIYLFNRSTLARLFRQAGFEVVHVGSLANSYPLSYWVHLFPMTPGWKTLVQSVLRRAGLGRREIPLKMGNIYIIARSPQFSRE